MAKRETKETRVSLVSRESQDIRVTLEFLDFLYVMRLFLHDLSFSSLYMSYVSLCAC